MADLPGIERLEIKAIATLWDWLAQEHARAHGVLLVTWKAAVPKFCVSREDMRHALVAYGWSDGRRYVVDTERTA
ncbi:hypothetical protein ACS3SW_19105 [Roseobacteraceae bacterium S113]